MRGISKSNSIIFKNIIIISELTKKFGKKIILDNINLQVKRGDSITFF